jgi:dephospho-CoA kinase
MAPRHGFTKDEGVMSRIPDVHSIGVTGGIASGKSTFARILADMVGGVVFDSDGEAKGLLAGDPEVRREVTARVDAKAYLADGAPDKARLRDIVFRDSALRKELEGILHPRVAGRWLALAASSESPVVVDSPLLFESGAAGRFDAVVVVACSPDIQLQRVLARGIGESEARRIIASQMPTAEKIALARHVVWNDGDKGLLEEQCVELVGILGGERKKPESAD